MDIALFLHLYQPPTQFPEVLDKVIRECYEPLFKSLENNPQVKLTVNMSASLSEQLSSQQSPVLGLFRKLCERNQLELVGSAAYHPLLTRLPPAEISRQINLNEEINTRLWHIHSQGFGSKSQPGRSQIGGFFAPEMAISNQVLASVKQSGYGYILADESAIRPEGNHLLAESRIFTDKETGLRVVCRHRELSLDIAFSRIRQVSNLLSATEKTPNQGYLVLAMDGETFGHHRPEQMGFLNDLFNTSVSGAPASAGRLSLVTISDLLHRHAFTPISLQESSWSGSFDRWDNPQNPIHIHQWQMVNLALQTLSSYPERDETYWKARALLDKGLHSDQFWWASHNPCWHYQMVQRGAQLLLSSVLSLGEEAKSQKEETSRLYEEIIQTSLRLYGDGVIAC